MSNYDRVIAINRAALAARHDYLMMMDNNHITTEVVTKSKPDIGYLFPPHVEQHAWNSGLPNINPRIYYPARRILRPVSLTGPGALLVAHGLGATHISVFGNDMRGSTYFDGVDINNDIDVRWSCEPIQWNRVVKYLGEKGVDFSFYREHDGCVSITKT